MIDDPYKAPQNPAEKRESSMPVRLIVGAVVLILSVITGVMLYRSHVIMQHAKETLRAAEADLADAEAERMRQEATEKEAGQLISDQPDSRPPARTD